MSERVHRVALHPTLPLAVVALHSSLKLFSILWCAYTLATRLAVLVTGACRFTSRVVFLLGVGFVYRWLPLLISASVPCVHMYLTDAAKMP
jgi:hypothetical protein